MNPRDFLDLAYDLVAEPREASWRSGASRAYYAAFHVALEFLRQCGFHLPNNDRAHAGVIYRLSNSGPAQINQIGQDIGRLRSKRITADYHLGHSFDQQTAFDHVQIADKVIETLDDALTMPALLAQITATIQVYERDVLQLVTFRP